MLRYRTVYISDGRTRNPNHWTSQGFTDHLNGAIRATAAKLAIAMFPKAMIIDRKNNRTVVTLSNTGYGIHIVRHDQ